MIIKLHRILGITLVLFVIVLSITGTLLQHADDFNIRQNYVSSSLAKNLYNIEPCEVLSYKFENHWISTCNSNLYFNAKKIADNINSVTYVYTKNRNYHVQYDNHEIILDENSNILEIIHIEPKTNFSKKIVLKNNAMPEEQKKIIEEKSIEKTITYERIVVDIHTGRIFGTVGITLVDLVTIGIILLSMTGTITWLRHKKIL